MFSSSYSDDNEFSYDLFTTSGRLNDPFGSPVKKESLDNLFNSPVKRQLSMSLFPDEDILNTSFGSLIGQYQNELNAYSPVQVFSGIVTAESFKNVGLPVPAFFQNQDKRVIAANKVNPVDSVNLSDVSDSSSESDDDIESEYGSCIHYPLEGGFENYIKQCNQWSDNHPGMVHRLANPSLTQEGKLAEPKENSWEKNRLTGYWKIVRANNITFHGTEWDRNRFKSINLQSSHSQAVANNPVSYAQQTPANIAVQPMQQPAAKKPVPTMPQAPYQIPGLVNFRLFGEQERARVGNLTGDQRNASMRAPNKTTNFKQG